MESRLERYKREKEQKKYNVLRFFMILTLFIPLFIGILIVDNSFLTLLDVDTMNVFHYSYEKNIHNIELFGDKFYIKQSQIDKIIYQFKNNIYIIKDKITSVLNK